MIVIPIPYRDPAEVFRAFAGDPCAALLDGGAGGPRSCPRAGAVCYIAADPYRTLCATRSGVRVDGCEAGGDPFSVLERELARHKAELNGSPAPFAGGAIGYFGYELAGWLERLPPPRPDPLDLPLMVVGLYHAVAAFDPIRERAWVVGWDDQARPAAARLAHRLASAAVAAPPSAPRPAAARAVPRWQPGLSRGEAEGHIRRILDYIHAGDIFQANYTQRFSAVRPQGSDDFEIYRRLRALSPAPRALFLRCGELSVASASMELFLRLDAGGRIETQPIKGTRPRHPDPARDAALAHDLTASVKDHAENLMIVDLMRNDLGRVCQTGSVRVPRLAALESFASVHHLVSAVEGRLRRGVTAVDVLRATFPGGSVTGAPKIRAMEIIRELEPTPRGVYCGCAGWIGFDGAMDMTMMIRTLTLAPAIALAQAGGGIVADSDPAAEYDECMVKIAPLLRSLAEEAPP